jgi:hypothetical protein
MVLGPKSGGDSLFYPNLNEDLVALTIPRGDSQAMHNILGSNLFKEVATLALGLILYPSDEFLV